MHARKVLPISSPRFQPRIVETARLIFLVIARFFFFFLFFSFGKIVLIRLLVGHHETRFSFFFLSSRVMELFFDPASRFYETLKYWEIVN